MTLYDFQSDSKKSDWRIIDDVVMGGRSDGSFSINSDGHGVFEGKVSLENNGGFSSVRYQPDKTIIDGASHVKIRLRGDGKTYQFRFKRKRSDYHSYVASFQTSGEWEEITIPLNQFKPAFRGRDLNMENFPGDQVEEIAFLIGNKKAESFKLEIDYIKLF
ncbi:CIA30 family protein [Algoriphagus sp. NBT04N3]|uniref:CIA30 family protein n=1 Tax=Algoriphagus sp. NBT04N3 TaxID=2705473 RepID=UPI001C6286B5|nr:CIA30 family protein [Algoriphagus sp. NBT04N3]QYH40663.1 CIA30 family protein [Algoriphagus sp. NBT04N3]